MITNLIDGPIKVILTGKLEDIRKGTNKKYD